MTIPTANAWDYIIQGDNSSIGLRPNNSSQPANSVILSGGDNSGARDGSTLIGIGSAAENKNATAVGRSSSAAGENATAVGEGSQAQNLQSVAFGSKARAYGQQSTSIGNDTMAGGLGSIAIGGDDLGTQFAVVSTGGQVVGYYSCTASDADNCRTYSLTQIVELEALGGKNDARFLANQNNPDLVYNAADNTYYKIKRNDDKSLKFAAGKTANDLNSINKYSRFLPKDVLAKYRAATASGGNFHNLGGGYASLRNTNDYGNGWVPTWSRGVGAITIGAKSAAYGDGAIALGNMSYSLGNYSVALGSGSFAFGDASQAIGNETYVYKANSVGLGSQVQTLEDGGMAFGYRARSGGTSSITLGTDVYADVKMDFTGKLATNNREFQIHRTDTTNARKDDTAGLLGFDMNGSSRVAGKGERLGSGNYFSYCAYCSAEQQSYISRLEEAVAHENALKPVVELEDGSGIMKVVGNNTKNSIVIGSRSASTGNNNIVMGRGTFARGNNSLALGSYSYTLNDNAIALGLATRAFGKNSIAIGVGTAIETDSHNTTVVGYGSRGFGDNSAIFGSNSQIWGSHNLVLGNNSNGVGSNNILLGNDSNIDSTSGKGTVSQSVGIGNNVRLYAPDANNISNLLALGNNSQAYFANSTAIGYNSVTDYNSTDLNKPGWVARGSFSLPSSSQVGIMSVGRIGSERRITNVAAGYRDTDAVNVSQLKTIEDRINNLSSEGETQHIRYFSVESKLDTANNTTAKALEESATREQDYKLYVRLKEQSLIIAAREMRGDNISAEYKNQLNTKLTSLESKLGTRINDKQLKKVNLNNYGSRGTSYRYDEAVAAIDAARTADENASILTAAETAELAKHNFNNLGAAGKNSIAIGYDANTTTAAVDAVSVGRNSSATVEGGVALGANSISSIGKNVQGYDPSTGNNSTDTGRAWRSTAGAVSVGNDTTTRQITNVAAGTNDTDAVNVAQLKKVGKTNFTDSANTTKNLSTLKVTQGAIDNSTYVGDNLSVKFVGNDLTIGLKKQVEFDKVTVGGAALQKDGNNVQLSGLQNRYAIGTGRVDNFASGSTTQFAATEGAVKNVLDNLYFTVRQNGNGGGDAMKYNSSNGTIEKQQLNFVNGTMTDATATANATTGYNIKFDLNNNTKNLINSAANQSLGNINASGKDVITALINATGNNGITVTANTDSGNKIKTFTIGGELSYKGSNNTTAQKVGLSTGLNFTNGTNIDAEVAANGVVKYNLKNALTGINSITGNGTTLTFSTAGIGLGGKKLTGLARGTANGDAVTFEQLSEVRTTFRDSDNTAKQLNNLKITQGASASGFVGDNLKVKFVGDDLTIGLKQEVNFNKVTVGSAELYKDGQNTQLRGLEERLALGNSAVSNFADNSTKQFAATEGAIKNVLENLFFTVQQNGTGGGNAMTYNDNSRQIEKKTLNFKDGTYTTASVAANGTTGYDVSFGLSAEAKNKIDNAANKNLDNLSEAGKNAITGLVDVQKAANSAITVTPTTDNASKKKTFTIGVDLDNLRSGLNLAYKANDGTVQTVSLSNGLNFKNGTNTTAVAEANGVVKFNLNDSLTGINSIAKANGIKLELGADTLTLKNSAGTGTAKIAGVTAGTADTDAVNFGQLKTVRDTANNAAKNDLTNITEGAKTTITNLINVTGSNGINVNATTDGNKVKTFALSLDNNTLRNNLNIAYKANNTNSQSVSLTNGFNFSNGTNISAEVGADGVVKYNLNPALTGITSIAGNNSTLTFATGGFNFGGGRLMSVGNGTADSDAVNLAQLKKLLEAMGGSVANNGDVTVNKPSIKFDSNGNATTTAQTPNLKDAIESVSKAVETANTALDSLTVGFTGNTGEASIQPKKGQKLAVTGAANFVSTTANDKSITIDLAQGAKDSLAKADNAADKNLSNISDDAKTKIKGLVEVKAAADSAATVTPSTDGDKQVYTVDVNADKVNEKASLSYKAESDTATKTTSLKAGLTFKNGSNITASTENNGGVRFDLSGTLKNITSIEKGDNAGAKITFGDDDITLNSKQIKGVSAGKTSGDAVEFDQLKAVTDALGSTITDGTVSAPSYVIKSGSTDANGATYNKVGDALTALDNALKNATSTANSAVSEFLIGAKSGDDANKVTLNNSNKRVDIVGSDNIVTAIDGNKVTVKLSKTLEDMTSIGGATNGSKLTFNGDDITVNNKKLKGVEKGTETTDAVNVAQLSKVAEALGATINNSTGAVTGPTFNLNFGNNGTGNNTTTPVNTVTDAITNINNALYATALQFTGDADNVKGKVELHKQTGNVFKVAGTQNQITTSTTANGQTLTIALAKDVTDKLAKAEDSANKNLGNLDDAGKAVITGLVDVVAKTGSAITVTSETATDDTKKKTFTVGIDSSALNNAATLSYKANDAANAQSVSLSKGLNFKDGTNTNATTGADGVVTFDVKPTLTGITSIAGNNNTLNFTANGGGFDFNGGKLTNIAKGTAAGDAVNYDQLSGLTTALGGNAAIGSDGSITQPSYVIKSGSADTTNGTTHTNVGDALKALDDALKTATSTANNAVSEFFVGAGSTTPDNKVTLNNTQTRVDIVGSDNIVTAIDGNNVTVKLSKTLENVTSIGGAANESKLTFGTDNIALNNKKLTGVEQGTADKDAVNYSQLSAVVTSLGGTINNGTVTGPTFNLNFGNNGAGSNTPTNVTTVTDAITNINKALYETALKFSGDTESVNGKVELHKGGVFKIAGTANQLTTSTTADSQTLTIALAKDVTDKLDKAQDSANKDLGNLSDAGKTVITGLVDVVADTNSAITVTPTEDASKKKTFTIGLNANTLNSAASINYKANSDAAQSVNLSKGFAFTNGTNTTAEVAADGVVKFNLNSTLDNISSISGINTLSGNGKTLTISSTGFGFGGASLTNIAKGKATGEAVNYDQLNAVTTALGGNAAIGADGSVTAPTFNLPNAKKGEVSTTETTVGGALTAIDGKLGKVDTAIAGINTDITNINNQITDQEIKYYTDENAKKSVKLSDGLHFTDGKNTTAEVADNGVVKYNLNAELKGVTSIASSETANTGTKIALGTDTVTLSSGANATAKLTGVTAGNVANGSVDAINGGQLHTSLTKLIEALGGTGGAVGTDGSFTKPSYTLKTADANSNKTYSSVGDALAAIDTALDSITNTVNNTSSKTDLSNITNEGKTVITNLIKAQKDAADEKGAKFVEVSESIDDATKAKTITVGINKDKLREDVELTYKANNGTAKTTSLKNGLDFTNTDNVTATVEESGVVKFALNSNLTGIDSIAKANNAKITLGDGSVTFEGAAANSQATLKGVKAGAAAGEAVNFDQLSKVVEALGGNITGGTVTGPTINNIHFNTDGTKPTSGNSDATNIADAIGAIDKAVYNTTLNFTGGNNSTGSVKLNQGQSLAIEGTDGFITTKAENQKLTIDLAADVKTKLTQASNSSDNNLSNITDAGKTVITNLITAKKDETAGKGGSFVEVSEAVDPTSKVKTITVGVDEANLRSNVKVAYKATDKDAADKTDSAKETALSTGFDFRDTENITAETGVNGLVKFALNSALKGITSIENRTAGKGSKITLNEDGSVSFAGAADSDKATLKGVKDGAKDDEAVTAKQLKDTLAKIGGGATVDASGNITAPSFTLTNSNQLNKAAEDTKKNSVSDALTTLDKALGALNTNLTNTTIGYKVGADGTARSVLLSKGFTFTSDSNVVITDPQDTDGLLKFALASQLTGINSIGNQTATAGSKLTFGDEAVTISGGKGDVKLTGLKDGTVSDASKDAITGKQLHDNLSSVASALGGGSAVSGNKVTAPTYSLKSGEEAAKAHNNVGDALTALDQGLSNVKGTADKAINALEVAASTEEGAEKVALDKENKRLNIVGSDNITTEVDADNKAINVKLNKDLTGLNSASFADKDDPNKTTTINGGSVTTSTTNADGTKQSSTQSGSGFKATESKDGKEKSSELTAGGVTVTDGDNVVKVNKDGLSVTDGTNTVNVTKDGVDGVTKIKGKGNNATEVTFTDNGLTLNDKTITGLAKGKVEAGSKDATTGDQLYDALDSVKDSLGVGSVDTATGKLKDVAFNLKAGGEAKDYTTVNDAFKALDTGLGALKESAISLFTVGADANKAAAGVDITSKNTRMDIVGKNNITTTVKDRTVEVTLNDTLNNMSAVNFTQDSADKTTVKLDSKGLNVTTDSGISANIGKDGLTISHGTGDAKKNLSITTDTNGGVVKGLAERDTSTADYGKGDNATRAATEAAVRKNREDAENGLVGTVIYTDKNGNRVMKDADGNYYRVNDRGEKIAGAMVDKGDLVLSLTNPDSSKDKAGSAVALNNVASGDISPSSNQAINGAQLDAVNSIVGGNNITVDATTKVPSLKANTFAEITKADGSAATANGAPTNVVDALNTINQNGTKYAKVNSTGAAAVAKGRESIAIGSAANAEGNGAVVIGQKATANSVAENGIAIGAGAVVESAGSVAVGAGSVAGKAHTITDSSKQHFGLISDAAVAGLTDAQGRYRENIQVFSVGAEGSERQIQHVSPGVLSATSTDAVNGSQLYQTNLHIQNNSQRIDAVSKQVNILAKDMRSGVASAIATANLPMLMHAGKSTVGVGTGSFQGTQAVALGYSRVSDNGKMLVKFSMGKSGNTSNMGAGFGYAW